MNEGAKVLELGVTLFEFERCREAVVLLGDKTPASEEYDRL